MKTMLLLDHTGDIIAIRERRRERGFDIEMVRYMMDSEALDRRMEEEY